MQYTLYHGDCLDVLPTLDDNSIDLLLTDPPYNTTALKWEQAIDWAAFWQEAHRICKPTALMILFSQQPFTTDLIVSNRRRFWYEIIWEKTMAQGFLFANRKPLRAHENIVIFTRQKNNSTYNPQKEYGHKPYTKLGLANRGAHYRACGTTETVSSGERFPKSVQCFSNGNNHNVHPTQKPLPLIQWLVRTYSNPGDVVLDCFMGSGTTGDACMIDGRKFIGIEREAAYYDIARARIEAAAAAQQLPLEEVGAAS